MQSAQRLSLATTKPPASAQLMYFALGATAAVLIGAIDYSTGVVTLLPLMYVLPVALATWFCGLRGRLPGVAMSLWCTLVWLGTNWLRTRAEHVTAAPYWSGLMSLALFVVVTLTLSALRGANQRLRVLATTDPLTGLLNYRAFYENVHREVERSQRSLKPLTVAYMDLDAFKAINDRFGHRAGDEVLTRVATAICSHTRTIDVAARLGGDEFAILCPETDELGAQVVVDRIRNQIMSAADHAPPVTLSIGLVTFIDLPESIDELLAIADHVMYDAKRAGKDRIHGITIGSRETAAAASTRRVAVARQRTPASRRAH